MHEQVDTGRPYRPYPVISLRFWQAYWITLRPYLFYISGVTGLAGLALNPDLEVFSFRWMATFVTIFFAYGLGQALTDCTQIDTDSLSSPYRPLVQGLVVPIQVAAVTVVFMILGTIVLAGLNPASMAVAALMVAGISTYTFFKRRFWAGPAWNSWVVAFLPVLAYQVGGDIDGVFMPPTRLWLMMGSVFFSYAVFVILGYFKDVSADRASGYETLVVKFGWQPAIYIDLLVAFLALGFSAALIYQTEVVSQIFRTVSLAMVPVGMWLLGAFFLIGAHWQLYKVQGKEELAFRGITTSVRGYVYLHAAEALALDPRLLGIVVWLVVFFETSLRSRPEMTQV